MAQERTPQQRFSPVQLLAFVAPLVLGCVGAIRGVWLCDDSFIPFRYVDQWMQGRGLVFNPGERVQGYSDFLWVIVLAAWHRLGFGLTTLGRWLPLLPWLGILALLLGRALGIGIRDGRGLRFQRGARRRDAWLALPVAAWGVALHRDSQVYASSGLETSLFAFCVLAALLLVVAARPRPLLAAAVYALATLVRPDGALYAVTALVWFAWRWRDARRAGKFLLVYGALVVPLVVWQLAYYGSPVPNTYWAKSANLPYWSQGWQYARLYFSIYPVLVVCLLGGWAAWFFGTRRKPGLDARRDRAPDRRPDRATDGRDLLLLASAQVLLTIVYVMRVGGDFMFARFLIPITPLAYLVAEEGVRTTGRRGAMVALALVVVAGTLAARLPRERTFVQCTQVHWITNEPNCYTPQVLRDLQRQGAILGRALAGTGARIVLPPGRTMVAWFGALPYAVEGSGLTDAEIARAPIAGRGRPGHEKVPSEAYLHAHGIQLRLLYGAHRTQGLAPYEILVLDDLYTQIVFWDPRVMRALRARPGVSCVDFESWLDAWLQAPPAHATAESWLDDYARLHRFYFRHNDDPRRLERLRAVLHAAGVSDERLRAAERLDA